MKAPACQGLGSTAIGAFAQNAIETGYVASLSSGGASIKARGAVNGKQVQIVGYDKQKNPKIGLVQVRIAGHRPVADGRT